MAKKFICVIIVIGCICALLGISFAKYDDIKDNVETIMQNNAIEIWKYKTEIEILGAVIQSYFTNDEYTKVDIIIFDPETIKVVVGNWENDETSYASYVPIALTNNEAKEADDIVKKYEFFNGITKSQYESQIKFENSFFATFFDAIQVPMVIIAILATIIIVIITMIIDSIGIVFNAFDLVFSLFGI